MNKDDIKKALECCVNPSINPCKDCPYNKNGDFSYCNDKILKDTLNLITEQEKEIDRLKAENEQLKVKLEKNPLAIKQKIMEEDDYELTEREQATLFLDRMGSDVEILHDIVENLDELLGKGINDYIMGIDGVEGLKDMWERSAVREFADKVKDEFIKSANIQDSITAKKLFRDICPVKVDKVLKKFIKEK